jgi:hypothetical protein
MYECRCDERLKVKDEISTKRDTLRDVSSLHTTRESRMSPFWGFLKETTSYRYKKMTRPWIMCDFGQCTGQHDTNLGSSVQNREEYCCDNVTNKLM